MAASPSLADLAELAKEGIRVVGVEVPGLAEVLTPEALRFVALLQRTFGPRRLELLAAREERKLSLDAWEAIGFLPETEGVRNAEWKVAPIPADLRDRRVEITGPVDRKMIINALNSGASTYMADFEDSTSPTWRNLIDGQLNLRDAVRGTISFEAAGKSYRLAEKTATLFVRPRGWHLPEKHLLVDGQPVSGSLFDFGLFFFHNARALVAKGTGPYFYLPKLESHLEARLWNSVFLLAQKTLGLPSGTVRATVLIETILAAFEMDEILWELRDHSAGLNCGRWDYIFSFIKKHRAQPGFVLPDRAQVTMDRPFLTAYSLLLIKTCHRRGIHAMGGMAAQIPIKDDAEKNRIALDKVRADKIREVKNGHDGTWVAHPGLVAIAKEIFDEAMPTPNQIAKHRPDITVRRGDLLAVPAGAITEAGLRQNVNVGLLYLEAWLRGNGCVPLYDLMEDAATAEISRTQLWQWVHHGALLVDGRKVTRELYESIRDEELERIRTGAVRTEPASLATAAQIFDELILADTLEDFLTLPAYERILTLAN
ncbi:MAG: malate synthase A [Acidobacteria bacterium]|nr:malate synthase A [Acidobacteriota bacterium]